ncbi:MAG: hypothetical protein IJO34_01290 [Akkermansia sp.]|nr:hypothetical protein [Akkermansia sp.]
MKKSFFYSLLPMAMLGMPLVNAQGVADDVEMEADVVQDGIPEIAGVEDPTRRPGEVPAMFRDDAMLDESHTNQELGINVYTAPSITKIFNQLDELPAIPEDYVLRKRAEKLPIDAGLLAMEMGYLLADGFIAVRSGHMNDVKPIALDLTRYGNALGVGDKMNAHSASLLENAEKGQMEQFKQNLASTQNDVNAELTSLKDPDLAHLIALGGWVRALEASTAAILGKFDADKAAIIFYPDAPAYFKEILQGLNPQTAKRLRVDQMSVLLEQLVQQMLLAEGEAPTVEKVMILHQTVGKLSTLAVGAGYEH